MSALASAPPATGRRQSVGPRRETNRLAELARERRLVGVAAFERQLAQRRVRMAQTVASMVDSHSTKVLARRHRKQGANALVEFEDGKARTRRQIGNAQRRVEVIFDVGQSVGEALGDQIA